MAKALALMGDGSSVVSHRNILGDTAFVVGGRCAYHQVLLLRLWLLKGEDELLNVDPLKHQINNKGTSSYSFGYGVSDAQTGDIKTVWETKEGDTVKGHYSVLEPDGSVRTVEYSAGPSNGFTAAINNEGKDSQTLTNNQQKMEDKSYRDYKKPYELSEDSASEYYSSNEWKNKKRPYDSFYKDYSMIKRPTYATDYESSDYSHSPSIKHLRDDIGFNGEAHSHFGINHDPNCKTKHTKANSNFYKTYDDLDFRKQKYPFLYTSTYDKYSDSSNDDTDKYLHNYKLKGHHKSPRPDETSFPTSMKYNYPIYPDIPVSENIYQDEIMQRPKKKHRPYKDTEAYYSSDDLSDYILVPKKKLKKPPRVPDISDYPPDVDEDYDNSDDDDERNYKPPRGSGQKEVMRKIIKKRRPSIINLLDILDI